MRAMILREIGLLRDRVASLEWSELPVPTPAPGELLIRVHICAICHTELDEIEGRLPPRFLPIIPGHQAIGRIVIATGGVSDFNINDRVGVAWIFSACGRCEECKSGRENLCSEFTATGRDVHGGYAEYMTVPAAFAHAIPDNLTDEEAAPLLCAGAIGYRSLRLVRLKDGQSLGLTGFGASGHLVLKLARHLYPASELYVFARNPEERAFALELGARWAGDVSASSPQKLHAIIDTTPAWYPILCALENLKPGGRLVINAIRREDQGKPTLLNLSYPRHLWQEKEIKSVANVTRSDVREFLQLAAEAGIKAEAKSYPLQEANNALRDLKEGRIRGAKILQVS